VDNFQLTLAVAWCETSQRRTVAARSAHQANNLLGRLHVLTRQSEGVYETPTSTALHSRDRNCTDQPASSIIAPFPTRLRPLEPPRPIDLVSLAPVPRTIARIREKKGSCPSDLELVAFRSPDC